ncbi:BlaI/MecI/CopY family transcriptional regulator [Jannaschia sp. Os4]|uniref:BlaI/MecI/CopY family transcriptional regulator n=1 Tax=Jannaschia sp. Os4 TaxID=2807617 RepID=UPI001939C5F6|nr:BlaI/MecI/CopY family transcriptional regulator [Jannaschia sp. Os4]MBM2578029.1 BlaI/MecI/CopY family transcriptional regulator [Jannaschia sp. Os4]
MARRRSELLTGVELELMKALWSLGRGTVRQVMAALAPAADGAGGRAYTSVATTLRILDDKGYLTSEPQGRALIYAPTLTRRDYEARSLRSLARSLFGGEPSALVARLVDDEALDEAEIAAIRDVIDARMGRGDG